MYKDFLMAALNRALRTFAEGMLGAVGTTAIGVTEVDWVGAASVGATAAIISVLIAVATGLPEVDSSVPVIERGKHIDGD